MKISILWLRRDLRLYDNTALNAALREDIPVLPVFIFDRNITDELPQDDPRITFIYDSLNKINSELGKKGSSVYVLHDYPGQAWQKIIKDFDVEKVYINKDYEPYATDRDKRIEKLLNQHNIILKRYKDQVIFEEKEVTRDGGSPYTVFTPYKNKWLREFHHCSSSFSIENPVMRGRFHESHFIFPDLESLGFRRSFTGVRPWDPESIADYDRFRDIPASDRTSYLSPHLRFGTVSIREVVRKAASLNQVFLSELIWREFFMQILFNFPNVVTESFRPKYDNIEWRNDEREFRLWCRGETGIPIVDAGMRQLSHAGYMHNRVRMITAGFLCKHLLIDWRWGEAWFADKLLDYELSSNNGNWQWAAGTGCDAAPYFRIFNPWAQQEKFDPQFLYVRKWAPESLKPGYIKPVVDHRLARERAISTYRAGLMKKG